MRSCAAFVGLGALLLAALAVGWFARDEIAQFVSGIAGKGEAPVESRAAGAAELARGAEEKIVALGQGDAEEATLSAEELNSWIRYGLKGFFPDFVSDVSAAIDAEDRIVLTGRVAVKQVPGIERWGSAALLVGDTATVSMRGRLDGLGPGAGVLYVERVQIGSIPLPDAVRDELMAELKAGAQDDVPAHAVAFELPAFVTDIGIRGGRLVLRRSPPEDD